MSDGERATFGGGCFWCVEAAFQRLQGVQSVVSGYAGGHVEEPSYKEVCAGNTGHAEVVQVTFDPEEITYRDLLEVFFTVHDPTQRNRQGPDVGPQYRSIILTHDEEQENAAESFVEELDSSGRYDDSVVTEIQPLDTFYPAEEHHQDYYARNSNQAYCRTVIPPKLRKLEKNHGELVTDDS